MKKRKKGIDKKLVGIIILIIIAGALIAVFAKYQYGKDYSDDGVNGLDTEDDIILSEENVGCNIDSDCGWHYTDYENNPCGGCSVSVPEYVCMNNNVAEDLFLDKMDELFGGLDNIPVCASCKAVDFDSYDCKCVKTQCVKERA